MRVSISSLTGDVALVRENILILSSCIGFTNGVGRQARQELVKEVRLLSEMQEHYVTPVPLPIEVIEAPPPFVAKILPLTLQQKRQALPQESFSEERYTPCRVMWVKVIIRAAYDYALWRDSADLRLRKYAEDARKWFFEASGLFNSFENICFLFRLPAKELLEWAKNLTRDQVKKFEFLERTGKDPITLALETTLVVADGEE
jgi:hypothetical protein